MIRDHAAVADDVALRWLDAIKRRRSWQAPLPDHEANTQNRTEHWDHDGSNRQIESQAQLLGALLSAKPDRPFGLLAAATTQVDYDGFGGDRLLLRQAWIVGAPVP